MSRIGPGDTLRILLIAEREALREQIGAILAQYAGDHRLFWVAQAEVAAKRAEDLLPHLVLVDDDIAGVAPPMIVRQIVSAVPAAVVLIMVEENGMSTARQAVLNGARGFVVKPLVAEDFWSTIYQLLVQNQTPATEIDRETPLGRVVVFVGPKGGTGRTMIATNTAISLQKESNKSVVLMDADYNAPALDVALNLEGDNDISLLLARISRLDKELINSVVVKHSSGIRVLLAPPPAYGTLEISLPQVEQIVSHLRNLFDWVLIDMGVLPDETGYAFLDNADYIVMTIVPELVCLRNTRLMLDQLHSRGYPDSKVWVVLNRSNIVGGVAQRDIEERLHVRIRHTIPDDQPVVSLSINRGVPLVLSHGRGAVAKSIQALATEFMKEAATVAQPATVEKGTSSVGVLGRMFRRASSAGV
ncbi:MAG: AAA family ATPase [Anaerolineales bacterium]|nr:AAA family ATPase [Anaerolineales bacterium]